MLLWNDFTKKNTYYKLHLSMTMRSLLFLLLAGFALVLMAGEVDAGKEPVWTFTPEIPSSPEQLSATISGDGEYVIVSAGRDSGRNSDGVVYLFRNNTLLWNYTEGDTAKNSLISENGDYVIVHHARAQCEMDPNDHAHCPPYFSVFRSENGTPLWQMEWNVSGSSRVHDITADGEHILVSGLHLLRSGNGTLISNYTLDINRGGSFAISADGGYFVVAGYAIQHANESAEGKITFFSKENSTPLWEYRFMPIRNSITFQGPEMHVSISEDGTFIAIAKGEGHDCNGDCGSSKIYLFNKESNATVWEYTPTDGGTFFNSIAMSSDGQYITASASDGKIYLFHRDSNSPIWVYDAEEEVSQAVISNDGKYIASFKDGYVFTLATENKTLLWEYNIGISIEHIEMSTNGKYVIVTTQDTVYLFENMLDDENIGEESPKLEEGASNTEDESDLCQNGYIKMADDGCNQCVCSEGEWSCTEMDCEPGDINDSGWIPSISLIPALISIGLIALRRRY